ncbi:hypothetical protein DFH29DRAFT_1001594 [Suillus ampliporus]|nr:hypothetical protein DFH29DRAFT_1001594 [Suillus ampliporus]
MPVVRPSPRRRSARLKALQTPFRVGRKAMEQMQGPVTRGKGSKTRGTQSPAAAASSSDQPRFTIQWQSAPFRTQKIIDHLREHPADTWILFYSDGKQSQDDGDRPSGKDKVSVCAVIAKHIFEHDEEYAGYYAAGPDKFRDSTSNHINGLLKKYCQGHDKLNATSAGIMLQDETTAQNLCAQILKEFPWYDDLAGIMGGNPALSLKTISSCPGVDHSANYFSISRMAGSSYSDTLRSGSAQYNTRQSQPPPQPQPPLSLRPPAVSLTLLQAVSLTLLPQAAILTLLQVVILIPLLLMVSLPAISTILTVPLRTMQLGLSAISSMASTRINPILARSPTPSHTDGLLFQRYTEASSPPRQDYHHDPNPISLDSPPRSAHAASKRPALPLSPSPPITPPPQSKFVLPRASQTSHRDGRASFNAADPKRRTSAGSLKPVSRRSSGSSQSKPASVSLSGLVSTSMTSPANSVSAGKQRRVKKQRSDIQSQVDACNDDVERALSDRFSWEELKNKRHMAKYNLAHQLNKHKYLESERTGNYAEAAVAHQRSQESKDSDIRLREAEIKAHDALWNAHAEEVATVRLKIELALITSSNSRS